MSTESVTHLDETTFDQTVSAANVPVLVDFWATWCGPCKMISPVLDEIAREQAGAVRVAKVNVDEDPKLAARFGVRSIPTLLVFSGGELKETLVGLTSKQNLLAKIEPYKNATAA